MEFNQKYGFIEVLEGLVGLTITGARYLTKTESRLFGWDGEYVPAMVLSDGTLVVASRDEEGNSEGCIFMGKWDAVS